MRLPSKLTLGLVLAILAIIAVSSGVRVALETETSETNRRADDVALGHAVADVTMSVWRMAGEPAARLLFSSANLRQRGVTFRWVGLDAPAGERAASLPPAALGALRAGDPVVIRQKSLAGAADSLSTYVAVEDPTGRPDAIEVQRSLPSDHTICHALVVTGVVVELCGCLVLGFGAILVERLIMRLVAHARRTRVGDLSGQLGRL